MDRAHAAIAARAVWTDRAQRAASRRVGKDKASVAQTAREYGVGWHTVMRAVERYGRPLVDDPARLAGVTHLGVDETAWLSATRDHHTLFVSGLVDTLTGQLLDVVPDRTATAVTSWLARRDPAWLARIGVVALDPYRGYATAMGVHLGHATVVVDHWHVIRLANQCVDEVRRRIQQDTLGHRGRTPDPLYRIRKLLVMAADRLDGRGWQRLAAGLRAGDPDGQVAAAWQLKELVRGLFRADDVDRARQVFAVIDAWAATIDAPECRRLVRTLHRWEDEILVFHTTGGVTNARTESANLGIKQTSASDAASATSTTTGCDCSSRAVASTGKINPLHVSEGEVPSWWRSAGKTSGGDLAEHLDLAVRQTFRPPRPRWALPGNDEDRTVTSQTARRICPFTSRR